MTTSIGGLVRVGSGRSRFLASFSVLVLTWVSSGQANVGDFKYTNVADGIQITRYIGTETNHLQIPALFEGKPVTSLAASSLQLAGMTSVSIPDTVQTIGDFAFSGCGRLSSVTIPAAVNSFGYGVFFECYRLKSVAFRGTNLTLGGGDFMRCSELETVALPPGLTGIPEACFHSCTNLKSIELPDTVTAVGVETFKLCRLLSRVRLSSGMTEIPNRMFEDCDALTRVFLPGFIRSIGQEAFFSCSGLLSITIPGSVTTIRERAFQACSALQGAVFLGSAPAVFLNGDPRFGTTTMFGFSSTNFTVFFAQGAAGFTSPIWMGYPSTNLNVAALPPAPWLVAQGLPLNPDLSPSLPGSGITLLGAYAFQLDPRSPDVRDRPVIQFSPGSLGLTFHGTSPGIRYTGEASSNLATWTTNNVVMGPPDAHGQRTLTLPATAPGAFLRARAAATW